MKRLGVSLLLFVSGALLLVIGSGVLFQPHALFASSGVSLSAEPSLMSEVRAPGGLLIASGLIVLLGAFRKNLMRLALALAALVYGTYGLSRLVSLIFDGLPSTSLLAAAGIELGLGLLSLILLVGSDSVPWFKVAVAESMEDNA